MRDLIVTLAVFGALPAVLLRPYLGVLLWSWLGYMNPHRLTWGFAYDFPFSQIVAVTVIVSLAASPEPKRFPLTGLTILWLTFLGWMCLTTYFAMYPEAAWHMLTRILKIQFMVLLTVVLMRSRERLDLLMWVIVLSLGFYGVKGGVHTLLTAGASRLYGPGGFIEDNNALAIALLMTLPLFNYLRIQAEKKWLRAVLLVCMLLMAVSIIGTYSRAAYVGGLAMVFLVWIKGRHKFAGAVAMLVIMAGLYSVAPQEWHERMQTIATPDAETGEYESSAQSRLIIWRMIINLAIDKPLMGAGLDPWFWETYERYSPILYQTRNAFSAHSIYFSVLAEHGFVGLVLFLLIFALAWRTARRVIVACRGDPGQEWLANLMQMLQISLAGYLVAGAFHQLPYFDLPWHIVSIIVIGRMLVDEGHVTASRPVAQTGTRNVPAPHGR